MEDGFDYELDIRHAELMIKELGHEDENTVATPGRELYDDEDQRLLDEENA